MSPKRKRAPSRVIPGTSRCSCDLPDTCGGLRFVNCEDGAAACGCICGCIEIECDGCDDCLEGDDEDELGGEG